MMFISLPRAKKPRKRREAKPSAPPKPRSKPRPPASPIPQCRSWSWAPVSERHDAAAGQLFMPFLDDDSLALEHWLYLAAIHSA